MDALNFALCLEPTKIRNERIAMLYAAYAIFGALFMSAVWIIYEWGSSKGYGDVDGNAVVDQYLIVSLLWHYLSSNLIMTLYGALFWMHSLSYSSSSEDYVIDSIQPLAYLHSLLWSSTFGVLVGRGDQTRRFFQLGGGGGFFQYSRLRAIILLLLFFGGVLLQLFDYVNPTKTLLQCWRW